MARRRGLHCGLILALACTAGGLPCATAASASTATLSPPGANADSPRVAVDGAGDSFAVWTVETGLEEYAIEAATRPAGGSWSAASVISEPGESSYRPKLAADARGDAVAVWQGSGSGNEFVSAAVRPAGGGWQPAARLSTAGARAEGAAVAIDPEGEATAAWQRSEGSRPVVQASQHPAAGAWSTPVSLSPSGNSSSEPAVAVDAKGDAIVAWTINRYDIESALRPAGKSWKGAVTIPAAEGEPTAPFIAFDGAGDAFAAWSVVHKLEAGVRGAVLPAGKSWQSPSTLSPGGGEAFVSGLAVDEAGEATAVWTAGGPGSEVIQSSTMPAHSTWQPASDLTGPERHPRGAAIVADAKGDELLSWASSGGANTIVRARARAAGAAWGQVLNLSAPGGSALPGGSAVSAVGAVLSWQRQNPDLTRSVQSASFPLTGALADPAVIPASASAGTPVSMSLGGLDGLAPLASVAWSFGDGGGATGTVVTHTYARPGSYTVSASGLDTLENALGDSQIIAVGPARARAPVLGTIAQTASSWREGTRLASLAAHRRAPVGTTFSFTLSEAATLSLSFSTRTGGRRVKGRCVAQGPHNVRARRCSRSLVMGRLSLKAQGGRDRVRFQGLLSRHSRLQPGSYTLTAIATTGGLSSAPRSLSFTIVR